MNTVIIEENIKIPRWIVGLASFRRWARSEAFPERGRISYFKGEIWVDMSPEELYTHNQVKGEFSQVLGLLLKQVRLGKYFSDGVLLSNPTANLSTVPDGIFVSWKSFRKKLVKRIRGTEGFVELEGTPDMTLEVVSRSSVRKDKILLRELYFRAGVTEYWLVDVRPTPFQFDILRLGRFGYVRTPTRSGWVKSSVFGKSFKLTRHLDELGDPEFRLASQ
ncbi:MAG: Uma2 family endonuclease [Planctomycetes bacterium]|nr:Uma2 family endonuclease [Planctomycetota bacterium]